ncbi:MAG: hypothetical protein U0Z75_01745 [Deinococcaceae bacterium]
MSVQQIMNIIDKFIAEKESGDFQLKIEYIRNPTGAKPKTRPSRPNLHSISMRSDKNKKQSTIALSTIG